MNISTAGIPKKGLPEGYVYIDELIPDCIIDAKYAGTDNFVGRPIDGYYQPLVVMTEEMAAAVIKAADIFREKGYYVCFFDSYRPQRASNDFAAWAQDLNDIRRKPLHYPDIDKKDMFGNYISYHSHHTEGTAVDMSLVDMKTNQLLDMGSIFDFMGDSSAPDSPLITEEQRRNRHILMDTMMSLGFTMCSTEWWHFNLPGADEARASGNVTYPDFPIE